ncbi:MAG: DNA repair protein RadC [Flavobacteriales bacterium]|nr:DNA repair protein RadC [Flavobacteriales bacterium]
MADTTSNFQGIKTWSPDDRPREKLMSKGQLALSDAELLAILIGSGSSKESAVELSRRILLSVNGSLDELGKLSLADLMKFHGMGEAKSVTVLAALEFARRRRVQESPAKDKIVSSRDAYERFLQVMGDIAHEEFWAIYLNRANKILSMKKVGEGGTSATIVDPKKIFQGALESKACSVVVGHNHPSGNLQPSSQDKQLTSRLVQAGKVMDCPLTDHIIVTNSAYFSFADEGVLHSE